MRAVRAVRVTGTGMEVPDRIITNDALSKLMDTSHEWIVQRTGIEQRRHCEEGTTPTDLAEKACRRAIEAAGITTQDIDLLLVATLSPQHYFPGTSAFLQDRLGMGTTPSMDVRAQCSGFIYAMDLGRNLVATGNYNRILICGVEVQSRALDMSTAGRETAVLFGDGAGAVVLEASDSPERGILNVTLRSEGAHANKLWIEAPTTGSSPVISTEHLERGAHRPSMDGRYVFKNAVARLPQVVMETISPWGLNSQDIDLFLFHQANLRINEHVAQTLKLKPSQLYSNIHNYGNTSAASIPICINECVKSGRIKEGTLVCLAAFGSGFTWASALIRW